MHEVLQKAGPGHVICAQGIAPHKDLDLLLEHQAQQTPGPGRGSMHEVLQKVGPEHVFCAQGLVNTRTRTCYFSTRCRRHGIPDVVVVAHHGLQDMKTRSKQGVKNEDQKNTQI